MHRDTRELLQRRIDEPWDEKVARLRETAPDDTPQLIPVQTSLPSRNDEPRLQLDMVQLHDLVHAAASNYLRTFGSMRHHKRHEHATRIAANAELLAWQSDLLVRGDDRG